MRSGLVAALTAAGLLGACQTPEPTVRLAQQDDARCRHFGAVPANQAYIDCRMRIDAERTDRFYATASLPQVPPPPSRFNWRHYKKTYAPIPPQPAGQ